MNVGRNTHSTVIQCTHSPVCLTSNSSQLRPAIRSANQPCPLRHSNWLFLHIRLMKYAASALRLHNITVTHPHRYSAPPTQTFSPTHSDIQPCPLRHSAPPTQIFSPAHSDIQLHPLRHSALPTQIFSPTHSNIQFYQINLLATHVTTTQLPTRPSHFVHTSRGSMLVMALSEAMFWTGSVNWKVTVQAVCELRSSRSFSCSSIIFG